MVRFCEWLQHTSWVVTISSSVVLSLIIELTHYFSFFFVIGMTGIVDLRILGIAGKQHPVSKFADQFFPWLWSGLVLVVLSGFLMFAGDAAQFFSNPVFRTKLLILALAIISGIVVQRNARKWEGLPAIPRIAKFVAVVSLVLWIGTILAAVEVPALTYVS